MSAGLGGGFSEIFGRELERLGREIDAYPDEESLWRVFGGQKNSPGTLALHIVGNLMHYIGAELGGTGFERDRAAEFAGAAVTRSELLERVVECRGTVTRVLESLDDEAVMGAYPGTPPGRMEGITTHAFLIHLTWHLGWHLGHIYYHRLSIASQ